MIFLIVLFVSQHVQATEDNAKHTAELVENPTILRTDDLTFRVLPRGQVDRLRIVGGSPVEIEEFPFVVFLSGPKLDNETMMHCGGSILSKKWAITAAHCYEEVVVKEMCFLAGTSSKVISGTDHCTENYHPHEDYSLIYVSEKDVHTTENDIAAVEVNPHFQLDGVKVAPVALPLGDVEPPPGTISTVVGWGMPEEAGMVMINLRASEIFIISRKECKQWYPIYYVSDQHICARHLDQWKGFCRGDSGGPLLVGGLLMGISSWTDRNCGDPTKPNVFAYVPYFREWISKTTGL